MPAPALFAQEILLALAQAGSWFLLAGILGIWRKIAEIEGTESGAKISWGALHGVCLASGAGALGGALAQSLPALALLSHALPLAALVAAASAGFLLPGYDRRSAPKRGPKPWGAWANRWLMGCSLLALSFALGASLGAQPSGALGSWESWRALRWGQAGAGAVGLGMLGLGWGLARSWAGKENKKLRLAGGLSGLIGALWLASSLGSNPIAQAAPALALALLALPMLHARFNELAQGKLKGVGGKEGFWAASAIMLPMAGLSALALMGAQSASETAALGVSGFALSGLAAFAYFRGLNNALTDWVGKRKDDEKRAMLEAQAKEDDLTGLGNRRAWGEALLGASKEAKQTGKNFAVFFIDVDHFKRINDTAGHVAGDDFLRQCAKRLETHLLKSGGSLYRFGGDEFVGMSALGASKKDMERLFVDIQRIAQEPARVRGKEYRSSVSIGVSICPEDALHPEELEAAADAALWEAKRLGRAQHRFFGKELLKSTEDELEVEIALRGALAGEQRAKSHAALAYQPKVDLKTGETKGCEALLRLSGKEGRPFAASLAVGVAERSGVMEGLGKKIFIMALHQAKVWKNSNDPALLALLPVSVNISPRQMADSEFWGLLRKMAKENPELKGALMLEVTESAVILEEKEAQERLDEIKALGWGCSLDDFGAGYSGASRLAQLPFEEMKIDRSLTEMAQSAPKAKALAAGVVALAQALSLKSCAEGIETAEQAQAFREMNCDLGQGYFFAHPMSPEDLEAWSRAKG